MHILIQVTWFVVSLLRISLANLDDCSETSRGYSYDEYQHGCETRQIICNNVSIRNTFPVLTFCEERNTRICNELIVINSNLSSVGSKFFTSDLCYLFSVTLSNCQIQTISEDEFSNFSMMRKLNLERNKIRKLEFLDDLVKLNNLSLAHNELTQVKAKDFRNLRILQILNIEYNNLISIGNSSYRLEYLQEFYLNNNQIEILVPYVFDGLTNLITLDLSYNPIKIISENTFAGLVRLYRLQLTGNNFTVSKNLFYAMERLNSLTFINGHQLNFEDLNFYQSYQIKEVKFMNTTIRNIGKEAFYGMELTPIFTLCNHVHHRESLNLCNASLQSIQPNAFSSMYHIFRNYDLNYNNLTYITTNTFQNMQHTNLLQLNNNDIRFIQSFAFHNISFCESNCFNKSIRLNNMQNLQLISQNAFIMIYNLKSLHLERSNVTKIEPFAFDTISFHDELGKCYGSLYLNINNISVISSNTFNNISEISKLYLDHNKIKTIERNAFASVTFCDGNELQLLDFNNRRRYLNKQVRSIVSLNNNLIENLDTNTFNGISNLDELHLENNQIKTIQKLAFNGLHMFTNLTNTSIYLNGNHINHLIEGTFDGISNLNMLQISHNNISFIERKAFSPLNDLVYLDLSDNKLNQLVEGIFIGLFNLNSLAINKNEITVIDPKTFSPLRNLLYLDLSYNNLSAIAPNIFYLKTLQTLNLHQNRIFTLTPDYFKNLVSLKKLVLSQNVIEDFPLGTFTNSPLLEQLQLGHNYLSKFKIGSFPNLAKLIELDLSHNKFEVLDESILYPLHSLNSLELHHNTLSSLHYTSLLEHIPTLQYISLNDNNWNCKFLVIMLKSFKLNGVKYLTNVSQTYTETNIDGIACSETEGEDIIPQIHSESLTELLRTFSQFINNSDKNMKKLITEFEGIVNETKLALTTVNYLKVKENSNLETSVQDNSHKMLELLLSKIQNATNLRNAQETELRTENFQKLFAGMQALLNKTLSTNNLVRPIPENNSININEFVNLTKESLANTKEMLKLLIESNQKFANYSSADFAMKKSVGFADIRHDSSSSYNVALYLILLFIVAIFCLLGFNIYKNLNNRNHSQRSELEMINSVITE